MSVRSGRAGDHNAVETGPVLGLELRAARVPAVCADMVVVALVRDEGRVRAVARHQLHPDLLRPERDRLLDVGDLEVHVAHVRARGGVGEVALGGGEHALGVERLRGHEDLVAGARRRPLVARPVAVDLHADPVGVVEVEGLRHGVVGCAGEGLLARDDPPQRRAELGAVG